MAIHLRVVTFDNRGDDVNPFGYIEFNDDTRLGYTPGLEQEIIGRDNYQGLWPANWGGNTPLHFHTADKWLFENFPPHRQFYPAKSRGAQASEQKDG